MLHSCHYAAGKARHAYKIHGIGASREMGRLPTIKHGSQIADILDDERSSFGTYLVSRCMFLAVTNTCKVNSDDGNMAVEQSLYQLHRELWMVMEVLLCAIAYLFDKTCAESHETTLRHLVDVDVIKRNIPFRTTLGHIEHDGIALHVLQRKLLIHHVEVRTQMAALRLLQILLRLVCRLQVNAPSEVNDLSHTLNPLEILFASTYLEIALDDAEVVGSIAEKVELGLGAYLIVI